MRPIRGLGDRSVGGVTPSRAPISRNNPPNAPVHRRIHSHPTGKEIMGQSSTALGSVRRYEETLEEHVGFLLTEDNSERQAHSLYRVQNPDGKFLIDQWAF